MGYEYRGFEVTWSCGYYTARLGSGVDTVLVLGADRSAVQSEVDEWLADNEECPRTRRGWLVTLILATALVAVYVAVAASIYFGVW